MNANSSKGSATPAIRLIVGLGNPGREHEEDRHNAGYWFVDAVARKHGGELRPDKKFYGEAGRAQINRHDVRLLKPDTWMNRSGSAVQALCAFFKIAPEEILVAHDELDLPPGTVRLKRGGGAGGHNGLRDIISHLGPDFARLRIGVGHPGDASRVTSYVLSHPTSKEAELIDESVQAALATMGLLLGQGFEKAMHKLHSRGKEPKPYRKKKQAAKEQAEGEAGQASSTNSVESDTDTNGRGPAGGSRDEVKS